MVETRMCKVFRVGSVGGSTHRAQFNQFGALPLGEQYTPIIEVDQAQFGQNNGGAFVAIVHGRIGNFGTGVGSPTRMKVDVALFEGTVRDPDRFHSMYTLGQPYEAGTDRAVPFMFVHKIDAWNAGTPFRVGARVVTDSGFVTTAEIENVTVTIWDLTALGASNYVYTETAYNQAGTALPDFSPTTIATSSALPWSSGTDDWLTYWCAQVTPGAPDQVYATQLVAPGANPWTIVGHRHLGPTPGDTLNGAYSLGSWRHDFITSGSQTYAIAAANNYVSGVGNRVASRWHVATFFSVRLQEGDGGGIDLAPEITTSTSLTAYGSLAQPLLISDSFTEDTALQDGVGMLSRVPTRSVLSNAASYGTTARYWNSAFLADISRMYIALAGPEFLPDNETFALERVLGISDSAWEGYINPLWQPVVGTWSLGGSQSNPPVRPRGNGDTLVLVPTPHGFAPNALVTLRFSGVVASSITYDPPPDGVQYFNARASATNPQEFVIFGEELEGYQGIVEATEQPGLLDTTTGQPLIGALWSSQLWFRQVDDVPSPGSVGTPGPEVVLVPGRESPAIDTLAVLEIDPEGVQELDEANARAVLRPLGGDVASWPRFLDPRRHLDLRWLVSASDREALFSFFDGLSGGVFRWTDPLEERDAPWVVLDGTYTEETRDGGVTWSVRAEIVELVFSDP